MAANERLERLALLLPLLLFNFSWTEEEVLDGGMGRWMFNPYKAAGVEAGLIFFMNIRPLLSLLKCCIFLCFGKDSNLRSYERVPCKLPTWLLIFIE